MIPLNIKSTKRYNKGLKPYKYEENTKKELYIVNKSLLADKLKKKVKTLSIGLP